MDEHNMDTHAHIIALIQELRGDLQRIAEKQDEMNEDVKKIKEAVYNPDEGLYARLRALEQWKENQAKVQWAVITTVIGLVAATVYKMILST